MRSVGNGSNAPVANRPGAEVREAQFDHRNRPLTNGLTACFRAAPVNTNFKNASTAMLAALPAKWEHHASFAAVSLGNAAG
jgi:hypothetical protein